MTDPSLSRNRDGRTKDDEHVSIDMVQVPVRGPVSEEMVDRRTGRTWTVTVDQFAIATTAVTVGQWNALLGTKTEPRWANLPKAEVSWRAGISERVICADPEAWYHGDPDAMGPESFAEWRSATRDPAVVRGMLEDHRAGLEINADHERDDRDAGRRV